MFFIQYRPDQQIGDAATHQAVQAASDGAVAVLSYSYDNLDRDFAKAKSHLTGEFLAYYNKFSQAVHRAGGAAGATDRDRQSAAGRRLGVASGFGRRVGVYQPEHRKQEKTEPLKTASSVLVTLTKVKGSWLIAKLDPL